MEKVICFYHISDLDGHCSGALVDQYYARHLEASPNYDDQINNGHDSPVIDLIGVNYGYEVPFDKIDKDTTVWIVDFSYPIDQMQKIKSACKKLIWIDHHKTAIEAADQAGFYPDGIRKIGMAGCELVHLFTNPDSIIHRAVHLLGRYDVWDHVDEDVVPLQFGLRTEDTRPTNVHLWKRLLSKFDSHLARYINAGRTIMAYEDSQNAIMAKSSAFELYFEGFNFIAVNRTSCGSAVLKSVYDPEKHDAIIVFGWYKDKWKVSMYAENNVNIDLASIAKKHGGGGHVTAASFTTDTLPFRLGN